MSATARDAKAQLRARLRERRAARTDADRTAAADELAGHAATLHAETIAAFVGTKTEPPTLPLLDALRGLERRVLLPVLQEDMDLAWAPFDSAQKLRPARLGLLEPTSASLGRDGIAHAGLVLAPALAVDRAGRRLGQGGGSYDRALERAGAPVVAVVFDDEVLDEAIPVEAHDLRVAGALTPHGGLRWFGDPQ